MSGSIKHLSRLGAEAIRIGDKRIGRYEPCFVIAEAGINHNGDLNMALELVRFAAQAGADAVKFQSFRTTSLVSQSTPLADYQMRNLSIMDVVPESQAEMLSKLELSDDDHEKLIEECRRLDIEFLSTPFDEDRARFLNRLGVRAYKISSGDLTNTGLLKEVAKTGLPLIVSTGMATLAEVTTACQAITDHIYEPGLVLLHCVSDYPAAAADSNLMAMQTLHEELSLPVGYSDHSLGNEIAVAAVALGACVVEKHFTFDKQADGPDHAASVNPDELAQMIRQIRMIESALGEGNKQPAASEQQTANVSRKSLHITDNIERGTILSRKHLVALRPGTGISPADIEQVLGHGIKRNLSAGEMLSQLDLKED
jgi:N,N'-diacetyllegionaminate synthase